MSNKLKGDNKKQKNSQQKLTAPFGGKSIVTDWHIQSMYRNWRFIQKKLLGALSSSALSKLVPKRGV